MTFAEAVSFGRIQPWWKVKETEEKEAKCGFITRILSRTINVGVLRGDKIKRRLSRMGKSYAYRVKERNRTQGWWIRDSEGGE